MKRFIIADTHFYHDNIAKYCGRPTNHTELLIASLQSIMGEDDILYHLGDVTFGSQDSLRDILSGIKGKKVLVRGNHDAWSDTRFMELGFDMVCTAIAVGNAILTHKPIEVAHFSVNIHGHLHNLGYDDVLSYEEEYRKFGADGRHILYSPELEGYKPVVIEKLVAKFNNRMKGE
ncbi:hypothetical protein [Anaeroselena agilis]|uniref:Metallophosphoesterase family protein n=1 Tax=Anaeroselena agilis TaxID=3063788 RepID=A0ABU3NVV9_9FIRM|nr:metallophosphoesterase family protein [Selenomonadales bacterium 4137-cl]